MKKVVIMAAFLSILACHTEDENAIPPVEKGQIATKPIKVVQLDAEINAATATIKDYQVGKTVRLTGQITVQSGRSYIKLSDGTLIQIYTRNLSAISDETKKKLATSGLGVSVVGVFTDYTLANGSLVREIVYSSEQDLTFSTETPPATQPTEVAEIDASKATIADYQVGKQAALSGFITVQSGRSYIKLSDGTLIQIYAPKNVFDTLSAGTKENLKKEGIGVVVKGVFTDYTDKAGNLYREIVYSSEQDLNFTGEATPVPSDPKTDITTPPSGQVMELNAQTATLDSFVIGQEVKLTGEIIVEGKNSFITLSDGNKIQLWGKNFKTLTDDIKTKLATNGQKIIVQGKVIEYKGEKQIEYQSGENLTFIGSTSSTPAPTPTPPSSDGGKEPEPTPAPEPTQASNKFDFEELTNTSTSSYTYTKTFTIGDVTIEVKGRTKLEDKGVDYSINGKGLMLTSNKDITKHSFITISLPKGVRELSFEVKAAFTNTNPRNFVLLSGDINSTTELLSEAVTIEEGVKTITYTVDVDRVITVKSIDRQIVIDNISWK